MGWDRYKLLWDGNWRDKYVPWTTLGVGLRTRGKISLGGPVGMRMNLPTSKN